MMITTLETPRELREWAGGSKDRGASDFVYNLIAPMPSDKREDGIARPMIDFNPSVR